MTNDPFERLRVHDEPALPDPRFTARLRARLVAALELSAASDLPIIPLPERSTAMTDTITSAGATSTATPPRGPSPLTPYLCVARGSDALAWYVDVLGATETMRYTGDDGRIGHAELDIAGARIYLSDEYPELDVLSPTSIGGTAVTLHLEVPDTDAAYERVVAGGATAPEPPKDEAYGARSFSMVDPFGHRWMIQTPLGAPTLADLQANVEGYTITAADTAPAPAGQPVVELGYFTLGVPDTATAGRFYGALFGWATEVGNAGEEYAHVANTQLPLGLTPGAPDEPPVLYFKVADVHAYAARVVELGGEVVSEAVFDSGPNAVCRDDQGRRFDLWQPAPGYE
ncbi:MAG: VOC family protein [Ilumatobacteraceae bacterium]